MTPLRPPAGAYVALAFQVHGYIEDPAGGPVWAVLHGVRLDSHEPQVVAVTVRLDEYTARVIHRPEDLYNCGQPPAPHTGKD